MHAQPMSVGNPDRRPTHPFYLGLCMYGESGQVGTDRQPQNGGEPHIALRSPLTFTKTQSRNFSYLASALGSSGDSVILLGETLLMALSMSTYHTAVVSGSLNCHECHLHLVSPRAALRMMRSSLQPSRRLIRSAQG